MSKRLENFIEGTWQKAQTDQFEDVLSPASGETLATVPLSSTADLDHAVRAAQGALPVWSEWSIPRRGRMLFDIREKLFLHREEIARTVTLEMGKTLPDARAEVQRMIEMAEAAAAVPTTMQGRVLENVAGGVDTQTIRQPVGVCAAIAPFNFPAMVPFWFLPFAIACGNTFILKPSEQVPLTQTLVFEILQSVDLPAGVVNLVHGGREIVDGILQHPGIEAVSFVGSAPVAQKVYERAAQNGKRVQALGGAKNHMVVCPDAELGGTTQAILASAFGAAGQRCMAGSVLVLAGSNAIVPELVKEAAALRVGDGLEEGVDVGPVISPEACSRIRGYIDDAEKRGLEITLDGRLADGRIGPTIISGAEEGDPLLGEEIFGPVLTVVETDDLEGALGLIRSSPFGNGASIFTESGGAARHFASRADAGMIGINIGVAAPVAFFPFSGWKNSFRGDLHAHGGDAIEFFTRKKTITSRYFSLGSKDSYFVE